MMFPVELKMLIVIIGLNILTSSTSEDVSNFSVTFSGNDVNAATVANVTERQIEQKTQVSH